jgi:Domain of unknown function (DUF5664)
MLSGCLESAPFWKFYVPDADSVLPQTVEDRKDIPLASGVWDYFTSALVAVARVSKTGNDQHNPGQPLFWDREKSGDEDDALMRHFLERGDFDKDGHRHRAKVAWRALAGLQKELELMEGAPLPRGAVPPHKREVPPDHDDHCLS